MKKISAVVGANFSVTGGGRLAGTPPAAECFSVIVLAGQPNAQGWKGDGRDFRKEPVDERIPFRWMIMGRNSMLAGESQHGKGESG